MELSQITFDFDDGSKKNVPGKVSAKKEMLKLNGTANLAKARGRKSLKPSGSDPKPLQIPEDEILFKKLYYSIGDVAAMLNENASLLRYWDNEFDILKPKKNKKGDRFFRPEDIKNLKVIHHLLRERKYTMEGAKEFLKSDKNAIQKYEMIRSLNKLKGFLLELKASL